MGRRRCLYSAVWAVWTFLVCTAITDFQQAHAEDLQEDLKSNVAPPGAAQRAGELHALDETKFLEVVLKEDKWWLVAFVAEWCGHCQLFKPQLAALHSYFQDLSSEETSPDASNTDDFDRAVDAQKKHLLSRLEGQELEVGIVECSQHTDFCEKMGVVGFPSSKLFKSGALVETLGSYARRTADIAAAVARHMHPAVHRLSSPAQLKALYALRFLHPYGGFLLVLPEGSEDATPIPPAFSVAAERLHGNRTFFAMIADSPELKAHFVLDAEETAPSTESADKTSRLSERCEGKLPCIIRLGLREARPRTPTGQTQELSDLPALSALEETELFISDHMFPVVTELSGTNFMEVKDAGRNLVGLIADPDSPNASHQLSTFRAAAKKFRRQFFFGVLDGKVTYREAVRVYGIDPDKSLPMPVIFGQGNSMDLYFGTWLNMTDMAAGLESFLEGGIPPQKPVPFELPLQRIMRLAKEQMDKLTGAKKTAAIAGVVTIAAILGGFAFVGAGDLCRFLLNLFYSSQAASSSASSSRPSSGASSENENEARNSHPSGACSGEENENEASGEKDGRNSQKSKGKKEK